MKKRKKEITPRRTRNWSKNQEEEALADYEALQIYKIQEEIRKMNFSFPPTCQVVTRVIKPGEKK